VEVIYLTGERVQQLHTLALEEGGLEGVRSEDELHASLAQVEESVGDEDVFPTVPDKAAAYGYYLVANRPFLSGNKRTAALAMKVFLDLNGYHFDQTDDEMADMFVALAARTVGVNAFFEWVVRHAHKQSVPKAIAE
jgi:death on curing protein